MFHNWAERDAKMMANSISEDRQNTLFSKYVDGELTHSEMAEMSRILENSRQAVRKFVNLLVIHWQLYEVYHE